MTIFVMTLNDKIFHNQTEFRLVYNRKGKYDHDHLNCKEIINIFSKYLSLRICNIYIYCCMQVVEFILTHVYEIER